ncbi:hypothetical protein [Companilactobacillus baiquanensis]|uniref:DUF1056 family protein n=1 Tax=Companilactobacillus baiquanensis TaxID=2486005 RepID=A0ABW1UW12_9LACO|nr:hypothetical protein [Companilactobacillus baiquanensis]
MKAEKRDRMYLMLPAIFIILGILAAYVSKTLAIISFIVAVISCIAFFLNIIVEHFEYKHKAN